MKEKWETSSLKGWLHNLSYAIFSYLCQECGLNDTSSLPPDFASHLPGLLPRRLTKYRLPAVRLAPGLKWNNPCFSRIPACPSCTVSLFRNIGARQAIHAVFTMSLLSPLDHPNRYLALACEYLKPWPPKRSNLKQLRMHGYLLCYAVSISGTSCFELQWKQKSSLWHSVHFVLKRFDELRCYTRSLVNYDKAAKKIKIRPKLDMFPALIYPVIWNFCDFSGLGKKSIRLGFVEPC